MNPIPTTESVELVDVYERYQFNSYELNFQESIAYVMDNMSKNFINKLYSDVINAIVSSLSADATTECTFIGLPYVVEDLVKMMKTRRESDFLGEPFILCSDEMIQRIRFWQDQTMRIIFDNVSSSMNGMPIYYAGNIGGVPVYAVDSYRYKGLSGQGATFDKFIVGFSGTSTSIGNRLCFSYLYEIDELACIASPFKTIQAKSEYKIARLGNAADLYITINIKED